ncbi:vacuolar protein sorting-associated protein 70 [Rhizoctonia solani AG-1 IA]|uniref:Vacuolar protein sorting-associated protein 70 n=1 Tax=Thanatephorus cucumeris (strain AG1-IA) TaxID=983506 RepID=L8WS67_THACA|nr:vacuolar protein sorting-associated protein 70 [Rhizoctonia solani AG-1 IA]
MSHISNVLDRFPPRRVLIREVSKLWTSKPHLAGSQNDYTSALELLRAFQSHLGLDSTGPPPVYEAGSAESQNAILGIGQLEKPKAWIDTYYPLLETPGERRLELLDAGGAVSWSANLEEHLTGAGDVIGAWHAFSKSGEVKARIVYANYGFKSDFEALKEEGCDVTGSIVLIREGYTFRGLRIKEAAKAGAIGCLTFKNPRTDDPVTVQNGYKPWPEGPARNPHPKGLPSIPSLPISWHNACILLKEIEDSGGKKSKREVRLVNNVHRQIGPIWNVMAVIPGYIRDEVVVAGNHRDAWVFGASDPTSGTVSLHEMSRGLGQLLQLRWKPFRTILLASWDGEEYGLFGSTEWGEDFQDWLRGHAVAYLNVDKSTSGSMLRIRGTPSIAPLLRQAALDLPHYSRPESGQTLWDARDDRGPFAEPIKQEEHSSATQPKYWTGIKTLGSGSGDAAYHYHSFYDSEDWMNQYGDPGCLRRVAIAKYWGLVLLRMANSFILPLDTTQYALELDDYLDKIVKLLPSLPNELDISQLRKAIKEVQAASKNLDRDKAQVTIRLKEYFNRVGESGGQNTRTILQEAFSWLDRKEVANSGLAQLMIDVSSINKKLANFERGFISEAGLPGREWYRHLIVAPGKWIVSRHLCPMRRSRCMHISLGLWCNQFPIFDRGNHRISRSRPSGRASSTTYSPSL